MGAYASTPQSHAMPWCPADAAPETVISWADLLTKALYAVALVLLFIGYSSKKFQTGGVGDYRVLGWILCATIFHTLQANRIHEFQWDPFKDLVFIDDSNWASWGFPNLNRLQVSAGVLLATVAFQISETMAFKFAGTVGPVHAAYIGTLIIDAVLHDMGHGQFREYSCTILGVDDRCRVLPDWGFVRGRHQT